MPIGLGSTNYPPKVRMFLWLLCKWALLTWLELQTRGWLGPNIYVLCNTNGETNDHIMFNCCFSRQLWYKCIRYLDYILIWHWIETTFGIGCKTKAPRYDCWSFWLQPCTGMSGKKETIEFLILQYGLLILHTCMRLIIHDTILWIDISSNECCL